MPKLRVEDLKKIKESKKGTVNLRDGAYRVKVTVHMGTCGIAAGARTVMSTILDELEKCEAKDIILTSSGCAGFCSREPMLTVEIKDHAPVKYIMLDEEKTRKVFQEHVLKGVEVPEYALSVGSETTY